MGVGQSQMKLSYITMFSSSKTQKTWAPLKNKLFGLIFELSFRNSKLKILYMSYGNEKQN